MKNYLKSWNLSRLLRLVLGVFIIIQGVQSGDVFPLILGAMLVLMPVLNVGCCSGETCGVPLPTSSKKAGDAGKS